MKPYYQHNGATFYHGDVLEVISTFEKESIDCVITSPAYWYKRNYGFAGQWGLEETFQEYLKKLWIFMSEVKRVLKSNGTVWVNIGDTYIKNGTAGGGKYVQKNGGAKVPHMRSQTVHLKSLSLIPHRFAIGCIDMGWICRNDIVWAKPNGMPESVRDRFNVRKEYILLFVKGQKYYFDMESVKEKTVCKYSGVDIGGKKHRNIIGHKGRYKDKGLKNPGDVWLINTRANYTDHIAAFPPDIVERCIKAGCPPGGVVLDPFCGSGTTIRCAFNLGRKGIGIDGNSEYLEIAIGRKGLFDNFKKPCVIGVN